MLICGLIIHDPHCLSSASQLKPHFSLCSAFTPHLHGLQERCGKGSCSINLSFSNQYRLSAHVCTWRYIYTDPYLSVALPRSITLPYQAPSSILELTEFQTLTLSSITHHFRKWWTHFFLSTSYIHLLSLFQGSPVLFTGVCITLTTL